MTHHLPRSPGVALAVHTFSEAEVRRATVIEPPRSFGEAIDVATFGFCKNCLYTIEEGGCFMWEIMRENSEFWGGIKISMHFVKLLISRVEKR